MKYTLLLTFLITLTISTPSFSKTTGVPGYCGYNPTSTTLGSYTYGYDTGGNLIHYNMKTITSGDTKYHCSDYWYFEDKTPEQRCSFYGDCPDEHNPEDGDEIIAGHGTGGTGSTGGTGDTGSGDYDSPPCSSNATCLAFAKGTCNGSIFGWDYNNPNDFSYQCNLSSPSSSSDEPCDTYSTCQSWAAGECGSTPQEFTYESPQNFSYSCPLENNTGSTGGGSTGDGSSGDGSSGDGSTGDGSTGDGSTGGGYGETDHGGDDSTTGGSGGGSTGGGGDVTGETGSGGGSTGGSTGGDSTDDDNSCIPTLDNNFCDTPDNGDIDGNPDPNPDSGGSTGGTGQDGADGQDGQDGTNGTNGTDGQDGQDGINGTNGTDGQDGQDGTNGTNGTDGQDGEDGEIVNMQELIDYLSNTSIDLGDWSSKSESKLDTFSEDGIPNEIINVQDEATSYLSGNGVSVAEGCPNPESIVVQGEDVLFSYQPLCDLATMLNPLLLAFTWMSALVLYFRSL